MSFLFIITFTIHWLAKIAKYLSSEARCLSGCDLHHGHKRWVLNQVFIFDSPCLPVLPCSAIFPLGTVPLFLWRAGKVHFTCGKSGLYPTFPQSAERINSLWWGTTQLWKLWAFPGNFNATGYGLTVLTMFLAVAVAQGKRSTKNHLLLDLSLWYPTRIAIAMEKCDLNLYINVENMVVTLYSFYQSIVIPWTWNKKTTDQSFSFEWHGSTLIF